MTPEVRGRPQFLRGYEEAARLLEAELEERLGGDFTGLCAPASCILACALRANGVDAEVCCGDYRSPDESLTLEPHAYVRADRRIIDPTRGQFDEMPLLCAADDPCYVDTDESWGAGLAPPARPTYQDAKNFIGSWWASGDDRERRRATLLEILDSFVAP